jgi:phospholipid transport system substrate-binding protein
MAILSTMKRTERFIPALLIVLAAVSSLSGQAVGTPAPPKETVKILLDSVRALATSPETAPDPAVIQRISALMDIQGVSKECLGAHWAKLSPKEQKAFVGLFQEVLEKVAYPKSATFFKDTKVEIGEVVEQSPRARVATTVSHPKEGRVEVEYELGLVEGRWLIRDVILDGVSLVQDLRAQMQKIIKEKSYEELKRKLLEKVKEQTSS